MDSDNNTVCPVCTLYLRPGITLKSHLASHPKQKVIEALVRLSSNGLTPKDIAIANSEPQDDYPQRSSNVNGSWNQGNPMLVNGAPPGFSSMSSNHSFIYHQFMSTSSQQQSNYVNPMSQQYVTIPTVINPQMMCQPYMYQQQQHVIMAGGPSVTPLTSKSIESSKESPFLNQQRQSSVSVSTCTDSKSDDITIVEDIIEDDVLDHDDDIAQEDSTVIINDFGQNKFATQTEEKEEEDDGQMLALDSPDDVNRDINEEVCDKITITEVDTSDDQLPKSHKELQEYQESDDTMGSPSSVSSDYHLRVRTDLSKACQTQQLSGSVSRPESPRSLSVMNVQIVENHFEEPFYLDSESIHPVVATSTNNSDTIATVYAPANSSMPQQNQLIDLDGMQLMLPGDFMSGQLISQVEDFECINSRSDRRVLMTLGGIDGARESFVDQREFDRLGEETMSRESTNVSIRADERMPPRGELSGQESNGATSDLTWSRVQYHEGSSGMSTSYDFLARETWEGSDGSDSEAPPLQSRIPLQGRYSPDLDDTPTIVSVIEPPLNFKCSICGEGFTCPKERRVHHSEKHPEKSNSIKTKGTGNVVGSKLGSKRVKKIVIKPKSTEIKAETNFDNVFTNKLKFETNSDGNITRDPDMPLPKISEGELKSCELSEKIIKGDLAYVCSVCNCVSPNLKLLKQHKLDAHNISSEIRYKCATCDVTFHKEGQFTEHLLIHPLECRLCGKYFFRRQNMQLHMKRHLGIKPFKCNFCEKSFLTKQKHDEHKNIHTGEAPIKCSMCDETFRRHSNLVQHRNRYHLNVKRKIKDYICFCGDIFHSKKKLAWHKEIHDAKPKSCTHCSEKFIHMASLTRHMRRAHNERFVPKEERNNENVECPICKGVYLRSSLDVHIRNHSGQKPYTCLICNKDFTTKWNLKLHKWTHAARTSKPFRCDQCKGAFIRETDYVAHMNSHKSVRPYTCNYCGAQFIRKYNCQRHVREHERGKTFSCQICGKSFHRSYYLKDHMRVHSGLRPYSCHICGKTSTTKSNHNKHVRIHHAREPISTEN